MYTCLHVTKLLGDRITCPIQPSNLVHDQQKLEDLQGDLNIVGHKGDWEIHCRNPTRHLPPSLDSVEKIEASRTDLCLKAASSLGLLKC